MGKSGRCGIVILSVLFSWMYMGMVGGATSALAADDGMKITSGSPQIINQDTVGEQVPESLPAHDAASVVFGKESHGRKLQVDLGEGLKAFFSVGSSSLDFDGRRTRSNYGATVGLNIPL